MNKRILMPLLILAGLAIGVIVGPGIQRRHVTFTALNIENHYDANGNPKSVFFESYSVWPGGSSEEIRHAVDGRPAGMRKINDLTRGMSTVLDTRTSSKTSYAMTAAEVERAKARTVCPSGSPAGTLLGYRVVAETTTSQLGDEQAVTTKKLAPSLDCLPLYDSTVLHDSAGKTLATTTRIVTAVMRSEPDRSELAMGRNFTERQPSEVIALHLKRNRQHCPECALRTNALLDEVYRIRAFAPLGGSQRSNTPQTQSGH